MPFAVFPPTNVAGAIDVFKQDVEILHVVVNGDENAEVLTENGLIPSIAKVISQLESAPFSMKSYTVATVPNPVTYNKHLIYVENGDAGQPCLAVAHGGTWKRISFGATISAT